MKKLSLKDQIKFFKLVGQLASTARFERELELSRNEVEFIKAGAGVETQDDARRYVKTLEILQIDEDVNGKIAAQRKKEAAANDREVILKAEKPKKSRKKLDANTLRVEDAERQKKFAAEQSAEKEDHGWTLPFEDGQKKFHIERFRKDLQNCGMQFCITKYGATSLQLKTEAKKLGITINWDTLKR